MKVREFILNDGMKLPPTGLGIYRLNGREGVKAIQCAMETGYRLLDFAFNYENEGAVDEAARTSCVLRSKLIATPKLLGRHQKYREALPTIEESLYRRGFNYYDIYLIHWPNPRTGLHVEAWQAMIEVKKRDMIRSIGVCNFLPEHLERLTKGTGVMLSINQTELHPYFNQEEQWGWDAAHGIVNESRSPLGCVSSVSQDPAIGEIAKVHGKSISQIILRWHVQLGVLPIPKSPDLTCQRENLEVSDFVPFEEEMQKICVFSRPDGRTANQNPSVYEEF